MPTLDEMAEAAKLVRWRANPKKIRVGIMKCLTKTNNGKDQWLVTVTTLVGNKVNSVYYQDSNPKVAVMSAL